MDASAMMGINVNRTISFTFLIAGGLAGAAGLLYALYVTTARYGLSATALEGQPLAGSVFVHDPGVQGLPPNAWAG
jgi:ABC-type uncharacterized transport system permease subunit